MKIIKLPAADSTLVQKALLQNRWAQNQLFERFAPRMLSVCRQYINDFHFAEDTMITGFTKAFNALSTFDTSKNFGTWLHQIMVYESISFLRKNQLEWSELNENSASYSIEKNVDSVEEIQQCLDQLPNGYRSVFLLFAVEGYNHAEISKMLNISEGTSKSQLHKARNLLQSLLTKQNQLEYERSRV